MLAAWIEERKAEVGNLFQQGHSSGYAIANRSYRCFCTPIFLLPFPVRLLGHRTQQRNLELELGSNSALF
jgi:hypothetical protein